MRRRAAGGCGGGRGGRMDAEPTLRLVMEKGPLEGQSKEFLSGTKIHIGRIVRGNTFAIKDAGISTKHLAIHFGVDLGQDGSGWTVSDLGSSNGTFLNSDSLEPFAPALLSDGDVIKIGECTSIRVWIVAAGEEDSKRGRQKPGRGGKLGLEVVDEDNELELEKIKESENVREEEVSEICETSEQMVSLGKKVSEKRTRGRRRKEDILVEKNGADENTEETENVVGKLRPRRGRIVKKDENVGGAAFNEDEVVESLRRNTRSMRKEQMSGVSENCNLITRKGSRAKKNVIQSVKDNEAQKEVEILGEKLGSEAVIHSVKDNEAGKEVEIVEEKLGSEAEESKELKKELIDETMEREKVGVVDGLAGKGVISSEIGVSGTLEIGSGIKADSMNELDLEKITLGEWFDYLEAHLPKQIIDATEEMILGLRQKVKKFHELMLEQKNATEKVGGPVA